MDNRFITTYKELLEWRKPSFRDAVRNVVLNGLALINKLEQAEEKYLKKPRIQFLYVHHIFKDEEKALHQLLKRLSEDHVFISYSDAVEKILTGNIDKPYISFSSDDGLQNNLRAAEILNEYNAKACFFINPPLIGETDYSKLKEHCLGTLDFPVSEFLTWDEVGKLQQWGHEIGAHTMYHMNIAANTPDDVNADLVKTKQILDSKCGDTKHFAFPYGRFFHFSEIGRKAVFDAGYSTCASAERGCHINHNGPLKNTDLCIRRDHTVLHRDLEHIMYFIINNARFANTNNNLFPPLK